MTAALAAGRRFLPRGYADLGLQFLIWFGFLLAYQVARGVADRDPTRAFANGWKVIDLEQRLTGLGELTFQGWTQSSEFLEALVSWTYWNSEFTVVGFGDTLAQFGGLNHGSGLIELASNPYAAMPSLHAADALIAGIVLASVVRRPV